MRKQFKIALMSVSFFSFLSAYAEAPVVDAYQEQQVTTSAPTANTMNAPVVDQTSALPDVPVDEQGSNVNEPNLAQRLSVVEQRLNALDNAMQQTDDLRQEVQQLRGQVETLQHQMQQQTPSQPQNQMPQQLSPPPMQGSPSMTPPPAAAPAQPSVQIQPSAAAVTVTPVAQAEVPTAQIKKRLALVSDSHDPVMAYNAAYSLLADKHYSEATEGFQTFVSRFPQGKLAQNSHYWLGELYLQAKQNDKAKAEFETLISQAPRHAKASDALYKIGYIDYQASDWKAARYVFTQVSNNYRGTSSAQMAMSHLQEMDQKGV